jgi:RNA-binding protein
LEDFDQGVAVWLQDPLGYIQCKFAQTRRFRRVDGCLSNAAPAALFLIRPLTGRGALYNPAMDKTAPPVAPDLSEKQRRYLRGLAHPLSALIRLGKEGLTDAVAKETARALHDHELIKVKGPGGDREARDALFVSLAERTGSALVHRIGNVAVLYRPRADLKRILIPD